jgi:hypothetical protein
VLEAPDELPVPEVLEAPEEVPVLDVADTPLLLVEPWELWLVDVVLMVDVFEPSDLTAPV